jgi:hypothetical protein
MVNGLMILLGESFRSGGQNTRERGKPESVKEQMNACKSHIDFINSYNDVKWNIRLYTYSTNYNSLLINNYGSYLEKYNFLISEPIGLQKLYEMSIENLPAYDFIFVCRIDLYLKPEFIFIFNYRWKEIKFPFICWKNRGGDIVNLYPRVSDTMIFIPKKYNPKDINLNHEGWMLLIKNGYTIDDIDVMINTYHDSDSQKDYNPIYYIVNRPKTTNWFSRGEYFNKDFFRFIK